MNNKKKILEKTNISIIIPLYNSEKTIGTLIHTLIRELNPYFKSIELVLVNDGSKDNTHEIALKLFDKYPEKIKYIELSKNFGEHNSVMCGLNYISGDYVVIMDDDLQNPPSEIIKLVKKLQEGFSVVYSYYKKKKHSWFRNLGSKFNDWVATKLLKKPKGLYLSSFKVIRLDLAKKIVQYKGPFPYIDGIILQLTKNIGVQYCLHTERAEGESNYTLRKLIHLWLSMFTGFSITPLRIASILGIFMAGISVLLILFFIVSYFLGGIFFKQIIPPGWASLIIVVTFFAGIQLILLGIIGEYLGRLFLTINKLPQYVVNKIYKKKNEENDR